MPRTHWQAPVLSYFARQPATKLLVMLLQPKSAVGALTLPAQHLLVVRVLSGWMNILAQIDCTVAVRGLAERWLPGFATPPTARLR